MVEANGIIALDEANAELGRDEVFGRALHLLVDVAAVDDGLYMLSDSRIGPWFGRCQGSTRDIRSHTTHTYTLLVHDADKICFCQQLRLGGFPFVKPALRRHKRLALLELRQLLVGPLIVREDFKIVTLPDGQTCIIMSTLHMHVERTATTCGREFLLAVLDLNSSLPSEGVLGAACQESSSDVLVDPFLVTGKITRPSRWVDGGMRVIIVLPSTWSIEPSIPQTMQKRSEINQIKRNTPQTRLRSRPKQDLEFAC